MKLYECDKCKNIINGNVFKLKLSPVILDEQTIAEGETFHLCGKCVANFGLWMTRKEDSKGCYNCKYCSRKITQEPCLICEYNSKWEAKDNG